MLDEYPVILYAIRGNLVTLGHPERGIIRMDLSQLINSVNSDFQFALPRRARTTPTSRFGWNWFMPLIRK